MVFWWVSLTVYWIFSLLSQTSLARLGAPAKNMQARKSQEDGTSRSLELGGSFSHGPLYRGIPQAQWLVIRTTALHIPKQPYISVEAVRTDSFSCMQEKGFATASGSKNQQALRTITTC